MKKMKNILSLSVVALCAFCILGISNVSAAASASSFNVACEKTTLEKGDSTICYILAQVRNDSTTGEGINGMLVVINGETKQLGVSDPQPAPVKHNDMLAERITKGQKITKDPTAKAATYTCEYDKCDMFYAKNGKSLKAVTNWSENDVDTISGFSEYTILGYYNVQLKETASVTDCGKLCVDVKYSSAGNYNSEGFGSAGKVACAEIKPVGGETTPPPETGNFASYAVLIGGAILALGAIALVRKNNKIYKI